MFVTFQLNGAIEFDKEKIFAVCSIVVQLHDKFTPVDLKKEITKVS